MQCPLKVNRYGTPSDCEIKQCAFTAEFTYLAKGEKMVTEKRCLITEALKKYIREE